MHVGSTDDGCLEQAIVAIDCHQRFDDECNEAQVVEGRLAWAMKQDAGVGGEAPVVVLAAAVDACEGFLVQETAEAMLASHFLHQAHDEHVVVHGEVRLLEDGSQLELVGRYLVVACLAGDSEF